MDNLEEKKRWLLSMAEKSSEFIEENVNLLDLKCCAELAASAVFLGLRYSEGAVCYPVGKDGRLDSKSPGLGLIFVIAYPNKDEMLKLIEEYKRLKRYFLTRGLNVITPLFLC